MMRQVVFFLALTMGSGAFGASEVHTVARGDTLYGIAHHYQTSVSELRNYNNLSSNNIKPGQQINIPLGDDSDSAPQTYAVRKGDSLSAIAARYRISVAELRRHNKLQNSLIHPGQVLFMPGGRQAQDLQVGVTKQAHRVRRGDSLWDIANRYDVSVSSLRAHNQLSKNHVLHPGQQLQIPNGSVRASRGSIKTSSLGFGVTTPRAPSVESRSAIVIDAKSGTPLYEKNVGSVKSIASITKLMTAMVALDANLAMDETLSIDGNDLDRLKMTSSRLPLGTRLTRYEMLHLALMSSENRAASALARHYPGGRSAFIAAMNRKAQALGMTDTYFADSTGLNPRNVSTARDLAKMVAAASHYPLIRKFTTDQGHQVWVKRAGTLQYRNSNPLVQQGRWDIGVSKTGYINEAGRCLVMEAEIGHRPALMVFLQSGNKYAPGNDANKLKKWLESGAAGVNLAGL